MYSITAPYNRFGRFTVSAVLDSAGARVAVLTEAVRSDPEGISGQGANLVPISSSAMPAWRALVDYLGKVGARGHVPAEIDASTPQGAATLRGALSGVTVRPYTDALGREQWAADGPAGTFLVTRGKLDREWSVWRSDSLTTASRAPELSTALRQACQSAGRTPAAVTA